MSARLILFISLSAIIISGIGVDLFSPSLPAIATFFHVPNAYAKLTISIYFFGFGIGQLFFGLMSDVYGRKPMLLLGVFLFLLASLAAPFSPSISMLLVLRGIQGIGAASTSAISKTLFADTLKGKKLAIALTYLNVVWGLGPIIAPVIGGYLQFYFGWQSNFYFYAVYSGLLFLFLLCFLKETHHERTVLHSKIIGKKLKSVVTHKAFLGSIIALGVGYAMIIVFNIVGPFLVQNVLGYSSIVYGHVALFIGFAYFLGTVINRILLSKISIKTIVRLGLLVTLLGSLGLLFIAYEFRMNLYNLSIPFFIMITGTGLTFPNLMAKGMTIFPKDLGIASAIMGTAFSVITGIAAGIVGLLKSHSPVPSAWTMAILTVLILALYWFMITEKSDHEEAV